MKNFFSLIIVVFFMQINFAQENQEFEIINHKVELGETVKLISKKYLVNPGEIYQLNKFAVNGISQGMILQIPVPVKDPIEVKEKVKDLVRKDVETETKPVVVKTVTPKVEVVKPQAEVAVIDRSSETEYTVEPKETLYSLSRKFGISVDEIKLSNPQIETSGLQIGMIVKIPSTKKLAANETSIGSTKAPSIEVKTKTSSTVVTNSATAITHVVEPKETLYSLSKKYGVTVDDITNQNATLLIDGLKIGQTLTIKK